MRVLKDGEIYKCKVCGNIVIVFKVGGGTLVRCGEEMQKTGGVPQSIYNTCY